MIVPIVPMLKQLLMRNTPSKTMPMFNVNEAVTTVAAFADNALFKEPPKYNP